MGKKTEVSAPLSLRFRLPGRAVRPENICPSRLVFRPERLWPMGSSVRISGSGASASSEPVFIRKTGESSLPRRAKRSGHERRRAGHRFPGRMVLTEGWEKRQTCPLLSPCGSGFRAGPSGPKTFVRAGSSFGRKGFGRGGRASEFQIRARVRALSLFSSGKQANRACPGGQNGQAMKDAAQDTVFPGGWP